MKKVLFSARKTPAGWVGDVEVAGEFTRELYEYRESRAAALNDASELAWFIAERCGNCLVDGVAE